METDLNKREFLAKTCKAGMAFCALLYGSKMTALGSYSNTPGTATPDPKKLNYCGYTCPPDCKMKKATVENNVALKKEAYVDWRIEKKYGMAFDPEKVFCYGCKTEGKPLGIVVGECTVRSCAIDKGYDCCIQCDKIAGCDKEIWTTYPDFHKQVIGMRAKYLATSH